MKGRSVIGSPARVIKDGNVSMEVKRGLRNVSSCHHWRMDQRRGRAIQHSSQECMLWKGVT